MSEQRVRAAAWLLALLLALGLAGWAQAQQPVIHYVYDDLGRLVGVVDPDGNAATYAYDAVGNILAISRHNAADTPGPVAITLVSPTKGKVGTEVLIFGRGFSADVTQNVISFAGAVVPVSAATPNSLTTSVPPGALTGFIMVTTPLGTATSPEPFTVPGAVMISPTSVVLFTKVSQPFTATESGTLTPTVTWSVNGIVGGNTTVGTISPTGLYTAPAVVPSPSIITVTATNTSDSSLFASATVVVVEAPDKILAHQVSVAPAVLNSSGVNNLMARPVSVAVANPLSTGTTSLQASPVSVAPAALSEQAAFLTAWQVAVAPQPLITSVTPSSGLRGVAGLSVLLTGVGFIDATVVSFQLNGSDDPNLSVSNLAVSPDGTQATFTLSITSGATPGPRVVRIATLAGISTAAGLGGNGFTVQ